MTQVSQKNLLSLLFSVSILCLTLYISQEFLKSIAWAGIIAIASWSIYDKWLSLFKRNDFLASLSLVILITLFILIPCAYLGYILTQDLHLATKYLLQINKTGLEAPAWIEEIPFISSKLHQLWQETLAQPNGLGELLSLDTFVQMRNYSLSAFKNVSGVLWHRLFTFGFSMFTLFYFFKDGKRLIQDIHHIGESSLALRWQRYVEHLPAALRATVNGILLVAIGVGFLMGCSYALLQIPAPALMGIITVFFACIPFGAPIVFVFLALYLLAEGLILNSIILLCWGTVVMFIADHIIRPILIGGAARLPFLSVLFGILGGMRCFGLLGLFVGPMIMVMFITLWQEWIDHCYEKN